MEVGATALEGGRKTRRGGSRRQTEGRQKLAVELAIVAARKLLVGTCVVVWPGLPCGTEAKRQGKPQYP